jgi:phosphate transport system permease protein
VTASGSALGHRRPWSERIIETLLFLAAAFGIVTTVGIIVVLAIQTIEFFARISPLEFFGGTFWSASIKPYAWGVLPLIVGTLMIGIIAMVIAVPLGLLSAVLLAEYSTTRVKNAVKPILETIAGIPSIVLAFFGLNFLVPNVLKPVFGDEIGTFSVLAAGIMVGVLVTPLIASISEDSMTAVPRGMREGAYAMGATRFEVIRKVVFPAAISGIMASIILAMSRAIGETMIVVILAGTQPQLTLNPLESVQAMTAFIVQISLGDTPQGSVQFLSLFAVAMVLFLMTLVLNLASAWFVRRYRTAY